MDANVDIAELERQIAEKAKVFDRDVTSDFVHVYEDPDGTENQTLIVQVAAKRLGSGKDWVQHRLRFSQAIRDWLIAHGDERYPLVQIFQPEEWALRND